MWRDQAYLLDMLTAARDARDFAAGLTRDGYEASRLAQYAVSHCAADHRRGGRACLRRHPKLSGRRAVGAAHRPAQ